MSIEVMKFGDVIQDIINKYPVYGEALAKQFKDDTEYYRKVTGGEVVEKDLGQRIIVGKITTQTLDRMGDVVLPSGGDFTDYRKNPIVLWSHDWGGGLFGGTTYELPHAKNVWIKPHPTKSPVEVRAGTQYSPKELNEFGDKVFEWRAGGWPLGYSIGFIPIQTVYNDDEEWEKTLTRWKRNIADNSDIDIEAIPEPERFFTRWRLLEYSDVKIPANPDAVQMMIHKGLMLPEERDSYTIKTPEEPLVIEKPYPNEHACRLRQPSEFQDDSFRRTSRTHEGKKYSVIMGKLKGENTMTEQAYRYNKSTWSASEARSHCNDHDGSFEASSEEDSITRLEQEVKDIREQLAALQAKQAGEIDRNAEIDIDPEAIARAFGQGKKEIDVLAELKKAFSII